MKVLFVGNTGGTSTSIHYFTNLVRMGHTVVPFNPRTLETHTRLQSMLFRVFKSPSEARLRRISEQLFRSCEKNPWDLIFVMNENFIPSDTLKAMRQASRGNPIFLYHSHDNHFSDGILKPKDFSEVLETYDFVFTTKSQIAAHYKSLDLDHVYYVPSAYEPTLHYPIPDSESLYPGNSIEVSFIGTYDRSRDRYVEAIDANLLKIWGDGWQRYPGINKRRQQIIPNAVYLFEFADILSHSKISLGLLREEAKDKHTQRTFEIPACGSLQICPRNEEILSFFEEDKEIVCFESPEELKEKVLFYLANESSRKQIANRGHERCLRDGHTYQDRLHKMLKIIGLNQSQAIRSGFSG